jgi:hypothetical protein
MPVPFGKRKRQSGEQVSKRKKGEDLTTAAPEAAGTGDEGKPRKGLARSKKKRRGASPGEYRPL